MNKTFNKLIMFLLLIWSSSLLFAQTMIKPQNYDLVFKVGQEFKPGEASFFVDDIEIIKKNKYSTLTEFYSDNQNYYVVVAEQSNKNEHSVYCKYNLLWISEFKYNGVLYQPIIIAQNHFYLKKK